MKKNSTLVRTLCLSYCHYYKPDRNEDLLCRGAVIIQRMIESGRNLSVGDTPRHAPGHEEQELVMLHVCGSCDFRAEDCDFARDQKARPCGGFELLARLLRAGVITIEDLR